MSHTTSRERERNRERERTAARKFSACLFGAVLAAGLLLPPGPAAAQEEDRKSSPAALQVYADAASFQNSGAFDLAIEEWKKFLTRFAEDPLAPKAQHYLGVCYTQLNPPKHAEAAAAFAAVAEKHPTFDLLEETLLNLGWSHYSLAQTEQDAEKRKGAYGAAVKAFSQLVEKFPKGKQADDALYWWGESHYWQEEREKALEPYGKLVAEFPESPLRADGLYILGVTNEELEKYAAAGEAYDAFLKEFPENTLATEVQMRKAETVLQAALAARDAGQAEQAGPLLADAEQRFGRVAAVKDFVSVTHAQFRQAYAASLQEKFPVAGALYAAVAAAEGSPYAVQARIAAGRAFYRAEQFEEAAKWLQAVVDAGDPEGVEAAHWVCRIHLRNGKPAEAVALAEKLLPNAGKDPYAVHLALDRADGLYENPEKRGEALAAYVKIAAEHPEHELAPQALYNAAYTALNLKQYEDGLKHANAFLAAFQAHGLLADVKYVAAECSLQLTQYAEAAALFRELVGKHGEHPDAETFKVRLGLSLYLQKNYQEVVDTLGPLAASVKLPAAQAEARFLLGASQYYLEKFDTAVAELEAALAADAAWRQADETLLVLSRAYRKLDQNEKAIAAVGRLLKEFPESGLLDRAHFRLGEYQFAAGNYAEAAKEYALVAKQWPSSELAPHARYGEGWSHLQEKAYEPAVAAFTALIDSGEAELLPLARHARSMCRQQLGDFEGGLADAAAYLETKPAKASDRCDALYIRGLCEAGLQKFDEAAQSFGAILEECAEYANRDKVLYELAWAYKSNNKPTEAVETFAQLAPLKSPLAAEANYHVGEDQYDKQVYAEAVKSYTACRTAAERGDLKEKATYKLAWSHFQLKSFDKALADFEAQVSEHPEGALLRDGLFMKAECLFRLKDYEKALPAYRAALANPPESEQVVTLLHLHAGQAAAQLDQWEESLKLLAVIEEKHAESPLLAESLYERGWAQQNLGKLEEALALYERVAELSRAEVGARARFMAGEVYFLQKNYGEAIKQFLRVQLGYGGEQAPAEIKPWQAKSAFEAARCHEVQIKDEANAARKAELIAKAKEYYTYVVEKHPASPEVDPAKKRLAELAKL